jgi:hypothetical protein
MKGMIFISAISVLLPALVALIRVGKINRIYHPFLYVVWLGALNELLSFVFGYYGIPVAYNNNVYVLFDGLLLLIFFRNFIFQRGKVYLYLIAGGLITLWLAENFLFGKISSVSSYYRIAYSLVNVLCSITLINYLLANSRKLILKDPLFLVSAGLIMFYTIKILVEAFWLYGISLSPRFQHNIYTILISVNIIKHIFYALAILWMPRKQIFTMPS